jgi:hypothetical protein
MAIDRNPVILNFHILFHRAHILLNLFAVSLVTTARHVPGLWMEETASNYGG